MASIKKSVSFGERMLVLETGEIARQASGAVLTSLGDTTVLVTVVGDKGSNPGRDFFPLTVDYEERTYSAGKIPGGFFKREGRPSEKATLTCRLIDRPLRPTFPSAFRHEVQVIATVLSLDPEVDPDIPALVGASAAIALSGIPFNGPIAGARVGYIDGDYVLNPTSSQLERSKLDLVVAGTESAVLMVESEAQELSEQVMLDAVLFGHEQIQPVLAMIGELAKAAAAPAWEWEAPSEDAALLESVRAANEASMAEAYLLRDKMERRERLSALRAETVKALAGGEDPRWSDQEVAGAFSKLEKSVVRGAHHRRRAAHRRPRRAHRARNQDPHRSAAPDPRVGPVHQGRNPGPGGDHARHGPGCAARRRDRGRAARTLHAALQLPSLLRGRSPARRGLPSAGKSATAGSPNGACKQ